MSCVTRYVIWKSRRRRRASYTTTTIAHELFTLQSYTQDDIIERTSRGVSNARTHARTHAHTHVYMRITVT